MTRKGKTYTGRKNVMREDVEGGKNREKKKHEKGKKRKRKGGI